MSRLVMDGISKQFPGVQALSEVSIAGDAGEVIGILGANGAGKSTLIGILGGLHAPDEGEIRIDGQVVDLTDPAEATDLGIELIHQELALLPGLSVAENIFAQRFPTRGPLLDVASMHRRARKVLARVGCDVEPGLPVRDLTPAQRQLVEIARALVAEARIVVFDEPTSSLSLPERERLFAIIRDLRADGTLVVFISHFLDDVYRICDRAYVLRDGHVVGAAPLAELDRADLIRLIVGHEQGSPTERRVAVVDEPLLRVKRIRVTPESPVHRFELRAGEVVGLWGLLGSGRTELLRALIGLDPAAETDLEIHGPTGWRPVRPERLLADVGFVPEDRRAEGLFVTMSVRANLVIASLRTAIARRFGIIDAGREVRVAAEAIALGDVRAASPTVAVGTLSGGNQQKVVFGRSLIRRPRVWLLDEPTRGLDVGAREELHETIRTVVSDGATALVITSDVDEMLGLADRVLVIGRSGVLVEAGPAPTKETLMSLAQDLEPAAPAAFHPTGPRP